MTTHDWRIASFLESASAPDLTTKKLSCITRLSPRRARALFKKHVGISLREYACRLRMERARHLLLDPSKSVKEVAAETGYTATSNFDRDFRAVYGIRPRDFRAGSVGEDVTHQQSSTEE